MKLYLNITVLFLIWVAAIITIFYFGFKNLPHSNLFPNFFPSSFANWDGGHYLGIADGGYDVIYQYAFFPLYPLVVSWIGKLIHSYLYAGILVSMISALLAVNLFYQLILTEFDKQIAQNSLLALLLFPTAFYLITVYTESFFLMLTLASFLFARKNNLLLATVFTALSSATRFTGVGVVLSLWFYLYQNHKLTLKNWYVFLAPLGFITYCIYLYNVTGNPFYFIQAEAHWHRGLTILGWAIISNFYHYLNINFLLENINGFLDFIFTIFAIVTIIRLVKKIPLDFLMFSIFSISLPLFSPTLLAMPRYMLVVFPIFIGVALVKNPYFKFSYQLISTMLLAGFSILFITGYWVT